jgi:hypothetical protein
MWHAERINMTRVILPSGTDHSKKERNDEDGHSNDLAAGNGAERATVVMSDATTKMIAITAAEGDNALSSVDVSMRS